MGPLPLCSRSALRRVLYAILLTNLAVILVSASAACLSKPYVSEYDKAICSASGRFLVGQDCDLFKAQLIQESRLNPRAVSPVGAMGLGQIMPATWRDICRTLVSCHKSPFDPVTNINAAAFYQSKMEAYWVTKRPAPDRKALALSSYNAGAGNITQAQELCGMATTYACIVECLPDITGKHSVETLEYTKGIARFYKQLKADYL